MKVRKAMLKVLLVLMLCSGYSILFAQSDVYNILDLWNVRNNLSGSYNLQFDIDLAVTKPAQLTIWSTDLPYFEGDIRRYSDGFAYYCIQDITLIDGSEDPGNTAYWVKMWQADKGWEPIGKTGAPFTGDFNGNNNIIHNLWIDRGASAVADNLYPSDGEDNVGLFGYVENKTTGNVYIRNVKLYNPIVRGRRATGSLVGKVLLPITTPARSYTVYTENCSAYGVQASVQGFGATGGLVGANNSNAKQRVPVIRACWAQVPVSATHPTNYALNPNDYFGSTVYNPYNIKYGGLVGCNENGVTQDSYARGNVSGGDRVGGFVGCAIGGAVYRCFATGTVTRGITPGTWEGGIGGFIGRASGTLPPGLGGTSETGSCENCYWDINTSGISTSPGGTGYTTTQMKNLANFINWDTTNVWGRTSGVNDGYPYLRTNASSEFEYRSTVTGNWNDKTTWQYFKSGSWQSAVVSPDASNSTLITILSGHTVTLTAPVQTDATVIAAGGTLKVNSGIVLTVANGLGTDLTISGTLELTGGLTVGSNALVETTTGSTIIFNGSVAQSMGVGFPTVVYDVTINNALGVSFTNALQIDGTLTLTSGIYTVGGAFQTDGFDSTTIKYLSFPATNYNIASFSLAVSTPSHYPDFIDREWNLNGVINDATAVNRTKRITFYWTAADDHNHDWVGLNGVPALYAGGTKIVGNAGYSIDTDPRSLTVDIEFAQSKNGAKQSYLIGRDDNQTLPVELSAFTGFVNLGTSIMLQWVTQSENNLSGYRIYRGVDNNVADAQDMNTFISGTNTSLPQTYVYYDRSLEGPGQYYYWLESVDFDGAAQMYGPVQVAFNADTDGTPTLVTTPGLDSVYPNPFNPETTIRYGVTTNSKVSLEIYNIRGQKIRSLFDGNRTVGYHQIKWNGKDDNNQPVTSGIYFVRMQMGTKIFNQKMVLTK